MNPTPDNPDIRAHFRISLRLIIPALLIILLYFFIAPSEVSPVAFEAPEAPDLQSSDSLYPRNTRLREAKIRFRGQIAGPEDIAMDKRGRIYAGLETGEIIRFANARSFEPVVNTGGRPLGMDFDRQGRLLVADAIQGLLRITLPTQIEVLARRFENRELGLVDDLAIHSNGDIYFTEASTHWPLAEYRNDILEGRPNGRLLKYEASTRSLSLVLDGLYFANGVALSADESFLLICETSHYRILRYWLKGKRSGQTEVFAENLPGFPDNIRRGHSLFWVALMAPRNTMLDLMHPYPQFKKLASKLPPVLQPQPQPYGMVLAFNDQGELVHNLQDPAGDRIFAVTTAEPIGNNLWLGTLSADQIGRFDLRSLLKKPPKEP